MWRSTIPPSAGTCYKMIIPLSPPWIYRDEPDEKKKLPLNIHAEICKLQYFYMFLPYLEALWVLWRWKNIGIISENICLIFFSSDSEMIIPPPWMYTKPSHREADIIYLICLMCQHTSCWVVAAQFFNNLLNTIE